jgi:microcystin-dependent protein
MTEPFLGEIQIYGFNFPPKSWSFCNGQLLSIQQNAALFSLLGTTYGGDGVTTFALPNLQGQAAISSGQAPGLSNYNLGQFGGEINHTLLISELPVHSHSFAVSTSAADQATPAGNHVLAKAEADNYESFASAVPMGTSNSGNPAIGNTGGNQPHPNMQPYLVLNFCIALSGIFPSRS